MLRHLKNAEKGFSGLKSLTIMVDFGSESNSLCNQFWKVVDQAAIVVWASHIIAVKWDYELWRTHIKFEAEELEWCEIEA